MNEDYYEIFRVKLGSMSEFVGRVPRTGTGIKGDFERWLADHGHSAIISAGLYIVTRPAALDNRTWVYNVEAVPAKFRIAS